MKKNKTIKVKLFNGRFQDVFYEIEETIKINAIITDPPYNNGYHYNSYKDDLPDNEYRDLFGQIDQFAQVNKSNICIMQYPKEAVDIFTDMIGTPDTITTWIYNSNTPRQQRSIFNYGKFYREQVRQAYKNPNDKRIKERIANGKIDAKAYDWWYINQVKNVSKIKNNISHSCPIPLELALKMVLLSSKEGDTVLDPFMGVGTIGIACRMLNRNFIGIELDKKYFNEAKKAIEKIEKVKNANS